MGDIFMNVNESKIHQYFEQVKTKSLTLIKASSFLGISYRHVKRLWRDYKTLGLISLISKKRGKPSNRRIPEARRSEIASIISHNYSDFKPGFATEMLEERHGIILSAETTRSIMIEYKIWTPHKGKGKTHQRRERRECEGELVQTDASDHLWFEGRGPRCHLYIIVDDATSKIMAAHFEIEETTEGYYRTFEKYFKKYGLSISIYCDKRGVFKVNQGDENKLTQFGRAMKELGIKIIFAHSPQAKGRVERKFEILQDRLIREMRLRNISTIEAGNEFLPSYLEKHNLAYGVAPTNPFNAHQALNNNRPLKYILCFKYKRIISKDLEVSYENRIYQIQEDKTKHNLRKMEIDVIETIDGEIRFEHRGEEIKFREYNETPHQILASKIKTDPSKKNKQEVFKKNQKRDEIFSKVVDIRGYLEREELLTEEEKRITELRLAERKRKSREENIEILTDRDMEVL